MSHPAPALHSVPAADPDTGEAPGAEQRARASLARARRTLPGLDPVVFDCYLGSIVRQIEATTEADPVGILASLIAAAGVHIGRTPHVPVGDDMHPLLVWPLIIGRTGGGRKGAGWSSARRVLTAADEDFLSINTRSGLTSGEGLAAMFAYQDDTALDTTTSGAARPAGALPAGDTRLLVFEPEWAAVMARMRREGNSLSATLRAAWEGGDLSTLAVQARIAKHTHIGILAHITPKEFATKVSGSDLAGGTYNRFLPIAVAQAQFLPFSQGADPELVAHLGTELATRLAPAAGIGKFGFTTGAATRWRDLYVELGTDNGDAGPVEEFITRAAPNCLRIAAIHAALDADTQITAHHLDAAAALVRYSIASARAVFTDTTALAKLATWIGAAGTTGRTRKEITSGYYRGNTPAHQIDNALDQLTAAGQITRTERPRTDGKGGRPAVVYLARQPNEPTKETNLRT